LGGQGVSPYEQKTQQWPGFGLSSTAQCGQSKKYWQAFVGMIASETRPHAGQVSLESSRIVSRQIDPMSASCNL